MHRCEVKPVGWWADRFRRRLRPVAALALAIPLLAPSIAESISSADPLASLNVQSLPQPIPAPVVALESPDGRSLRLEDLRGKVVFLNFWATWCVPCREEMPAMERLHRAYGEHGLVIVAVNFKESRAETQKYIKELGLTLGVALDPDGAAASTFGVRGLPVTFLLARNGRILWKALGSREWDNPAGRAYFEKVLDAPRP